MSIVSAKELRGRTMGLAMDRTRTRKKKFLVKGTTAHEDILTIYTYIGIPTQSVWTDSATGYYDQYCVCTGMEVEQNEKNPLYYFATYSYSTLPLGNGLPDPGDIDNPASRPIRVSEFCVRYTKRGDRDKDNLAIKNSAGQPLRDVPEIEAYRNAWRVEFYTTTALGQAWRENYVGKVNSTLWKIFLARHLLLDDAQSEPQYESGQVFYQNTLTFIANADTWDDSFFDIGMMQIGGDGKLHRILDKDGREVTEPVFLNGAGKYDDPPTPTLITPAFRRRKEADFSLMGLEGVTFQS